MEEYVFSTLCGIGLNYIAALEASVPFAKGELLVSTKRYHVKFNLTGFFYIKQYSALIC